MREAVLAHSGEALNSRKAFQALSAGEQDTVIEFLKLLQILPPRTMDSFRGGNRRQGEESDE